ncbi:hypothetical protein [Natrialba sp. INN-245]|uniref:hypothetical protein n=1 Tax=Natrialba sp. INN-245 TaxID=2690967 RepID=UPI0013137668|nr:hypothetical protein [Natrialba sp. INN-245]MWV38307.1 hypothetical protein [Natrialba sp. INN-245]
MTSRSAGGRTSSPTAIWLPIGDGAVVGAGATLDVPCEGADGIDPDAYPSATLSASSRD